MDFYVTSCYIGGETLHKAIYNSRHNFMILSYKPTLQKLGMVVNAFNPSTWWGQPTLHSEFQTSQRYTERACIKSITIKLHYRKVLMLMELINSACKCFYQSTSLLLLCIKTFIYSTCMSVMYVYVQYVWCPRWSKENASSSGT